MEMAYIKVFLDWKKKTRKLSFEEKGRLIDALVDYASGNSDVENTLLGNEEYVFPIFQTQIDRDREELEELSRTRSESGKKGGRPKKANDSINKQKKQMVFSESKKSYIKEKEYEKEEEKEKEYEDKKEEDTLKTQSQEKPHTHIQSPGFPNLLAPASMIDVSQPFKTNNIQTSSHYKPAWFERFWELYPNKIGKIDAMQAWDCIRPDEDLCAIIGKAIETWKKTQQWKNGKIPSPANWLRGGRWTDEVPKEVDPYDHFPTLDRKTGKFISN